MRCCAIWIIPVLGLAGSPSLPQPLSPEEIVQGAAERIELYRKLDDFLKPWAPAWQSVQ